MISVQFLLYHLLKRNLIDLVLPNPVRHTTFFAPANNRLTDDVAFSRDRDKNFPAADSG